MAFTSQHGTAPKERKVRQLRNDAGDLIQTQEENTGEKRLQQPFPGAGIRADGSLPKRDTTKDTDDSGIKPSAPTPSGTGKHADIVTDNKGTYESVGDRDNRMLNEDMASEHETTIGSIIEEDAATSRESEISKTY